MYSLMNVKKKEKKNRKQKNDEDRGFILDKQDFLVGNTYLSRLLKSSTEKLSFEEYNKIIGKTNPIVNEIGDYIDRLIVEKKITPIETLVVIDSIYRTASMNFYYRFGKVFNKKIDNIMYG